MPPCNLHCYRHYIPHRVYTAAAVRSTHHSTVTILLLAWVLREEGGGSLASCGLHRPKCCRQALSRGHSPLPRPPYWLGVTYVFACNAETSGDAPEHSGPPSGLSATGDLQTLRAMRWRAPHHQVTSRTCWMSSCHASGLMAC